MYLFIYWLCRTTCRILVPWPGIEPVPPAVKAQSLNHWTTREVPTQLLQAELIDYQDINYH